MSLFKKVHDVVWNTYNFGQIGIDLWELSGANGLKWLKIVGFKLQCINAEGQVHGRGQGGSEE